MPLSGITFLSGNTYTILNEIIPGGLYKYAICSVTALTQVISGHSKPTNQLLQAYLCILPKQKDTINRVLVDYLIRTDVPTYCDQFAAVIPGLS